jgi:hypothetical protein
MHWTRAGALCAVLACASTPAAAQNLFEVQVFPDETIERGETEIEFHNVLIPASAAQTGSSPAGHTHLSVEMSHGWTDAFETGIFVETAPDPEDGHAAISGWHVRPKFRVASASSFPFHVSASVEYAFFKNPGAQAFRQALTITPIFEHHARSWEVSLNPGMQMAVTGPGAWSAPAFEPSARIASRTAKPIAFGLEYYAETGTLRRFEPVSSQQHLVFSTVDVHGQSGWDVNVGVGRGLTGGSEHWVVKTILAVRVNP